MVSQVDVLFIVPSILRVLLIIPLNIYQQRLRCLERKDYSFSNMWLGSIILILVVVSNGLNIFVYSLPGQCDSTFCPEYRGELPTGALIGFFGQILCMLVVVKCHHNVAGCLVVIAQYSFTIALAIQQQSIANDYVGIALSLLFQSLIVYDNRRYLHRTHMTVLEIEETTRNRLESEQKHKMEELVSSELRYLIGNVAHDLKTPLQSFSLELETLSDVAHESSVSQEVCDQLTESVSLLENVCSFMLMTINRAIDHTKTSSGIVLIPKHETVNIKDAMLWVAQCMGKSESVPLVIDPIPPGICSHVITDRQWLLENVLCLVSNAHKFTTVGSVHISCSLVCSSSLRDRDVAAAFQHNGHTSANSDISTLEASEHVAEDLEMIQRQLVTDVENGVRNSMKLGDNSTNSSPTNVLLIEVEDTGIGIPAEKRKALFQPFQQAQRRAGGTGLGLFSMCNRIAALGGVCGVSDRHDGANGALFWFTLPYRPDDTLQPDEDVSPDRPAASSPVKTPATLPTPGIDKLTENKQGSLRDLLHKEPSMHSLVLLVEDSLMIQKATRRAFQRANIHIDVAVNGVECLQMIERHEYTLILMDIQMPVMDGLEAVRRIRQIEADSASQTKSGVVVVGLSANSDSESEKEAMAAGMDSFLSKPLSLEVLKEHLVRLDSPLVPMLPAEKE